MDLVSHLNPLQYFERHRLRVQHLRPATRGLNSAVWLTDEYALKCSKNANVNHAREVQLARHALNLGIRTAEPLFWGEDYSLWRRLPGDAATPPQPQAVWAGLLDDLERFHAQPPEVAPDLERWVAVPFPWGRAAYRPGIWEGDARLLETAFAANLMAHEKTRGLELFQARPIGQLKFLHADAFAGNILAEHGEYLGLIDWGNAQWHALEREYAWMEDQALEIALGRYDLDLELLYAIRLELFLSMGQHGFATLEQVRDILERASKKPSFTRR